MSARDDRPRQGVRRVVPNRVFLAYPWETYRKHYEDVCARLHRSYPVYFFAVGRERGVPAADLFARIKHVIATASYAVFDASKGNPNVSLEFGIADVTAKLEVFLLIDEHTVPTRATAGTPIIADLAGVTQNRWRIDEPGSLRDQLKAIADRHPYTKRFRKWTKRHGMRGGEIQGHLRIIRRLDERDDILRRELIDELVAEGLGQDVVESRLKELHRAGLITISRGREWASKVWVS